jgi:hypothetical protein
MATSREKKIVSKIRQIQQAQLDIEARMSDSLSEVFRGLSDQVIEIADNLSLDPKNRAKSLRELMKLKVDIADVIASNPLYQSEVAAVIEKFATLQTLSNEYMGLIIDDFIPKKELYKAILEVNIQTTTDALIGGGIRDNFKNAIQEVLKENITGKSSRVQLNKTLRKFIEGTPEEKPFLERYIRQTTNDAVMAFNREYIQTISDDLDLQHYFYSGTIIDETRPFCKSRTGKYFTKEEVQKWADLSWQGKMSGTNKNTIFTYAGGYNCRHTIWPVTEEQYNAAMGKGEVGLTP